MTSRSVSPPTPEPEQGEANSANTAEIRGRAEALGDVIDTAIGWSIAHEAYGLLALLHAGQRRAYGMDEECDCDHCVQTLAVARASLRSLESALPEGSVTPEERRTRAGEPT